MALRQTARALAGLARGAPAGTRGMAAHADAEARWAKFFPRMQEAPDTHSKHLRKEMLGFLLLGPVGVAFMLYDFVFGLEHVHDHVIPPYPWMRRRLLPGMPWGEHGLFEYKRYVATEWPLPEEAEEHGHH